MHLPTDIGLITCQYNVLSMLTPFLCNNYIFLLSVLSVYNLLSEFFGRPPPSHLKTTTFIVMPLVTTIACITAVLVCGMDAVAVLKSYPYTCYREGELLNIQGITNDPCITCTCMDGTAQCTTKKCPPLEGCPVAVRNNPNSCCMQCKECQYLDVTYINGEQWMSTQDSCRRLTCKAGVVTSARIHCVVPCQHPHRLIGYCCPVCLRSDVGNATLLDLKSILGVCVQCECDEHSCHCYRTACPVLDCPVSEQYIPEQSCCPECRKSRENIALPVRTCHFRNTIYQFEQSFRPDPCTLCMCQESGILCRRFVCSPLNCPKQRQQFIPGLCCPVCRNYDLQSCTFRDKLYKDGQSFKRDVCTKCECSNGKVSCHRQKCSKRKRCPAGYAAKLLPGQCCSICVEKDATCTVLGEGRYRTFDGREFKFQGSCRYVLTQDCQYNGRFQARAFTVIVQNEIYPAARIRHVSIRLPNKIRISLLPNKKVRVNRKDISLPYVELGSFSVMYDKSFNILLRLNAGLKIVWDGNSYIDATVSVKYKDRLCGLCGNYNHDKKDDFITRSGFLVNSAQRFGRSWRFGNWRTCKSVQDRKYYRANSRKNKWRPLIEKSENRQKARIAWIMLNDRQEPSLDQDFSNATFFEQQQQHANITALFDSLF
ncbi:BMP-binding endothelial regulator protein [Trichinella murrelli]|uniref:BMP-binding endothelial regulator protein n=1 Tax=Trichinella murrelli TaxID=144512 RepID=A0A0V0TMB1_9BILA|nr:BMP-binding endothelial regulator protein [Trichinella murrelli]